MRNCINNKVLAYVFAVLSLLLLFVANLSYGYVNIPFDEVLSILAGNESGCKWSVIVLELRLPQALTAVMAGAAISVAGLLLQTVLRNPLAGPEVLGVNSGAGLGVAVVMLCGISFFGFNSYWAELGGALVGALLVMLVIMFLSTLLRNNMFLLIAGVAVSYIASSAITLLNYFTTAEGLQSYTVWGMGDLGAVSMEKIVFFAPIILLLLFISLMMMKPLNAMLVGDAYATNLGVNVKRVRSVALCVSGLLSAVVISFCGPVSFIGLAVPHIARISLRSNNHCHLIPSTIILGATVTLLCNLVCQLANSATPLPLNAVTPLVGAPVIIYVVLKNRGLR